VAEDLTVRVREAAGEPEGALVLFHGRGADEHDLEPLFDVLDPERRFAGFSPRGPLSLPPGGAHWYAVREIGYPDPSTFLPTYELVGAWLDTLGFPSERTILCGFSQGAVMSYALSLGRGGACPGAVVVVRGFVPTVDGLELDLDAPLPRYAVGHGTLDPVIRVEWSRRARALLEEAGAEVRYAEYPLPHAIHPGFLLQVRDWLTERVGSAV
jgi:phospholipase/carboxylesterase